MELRRQPEPVKLTFEGDPRDVDEYIRKVCGAIERTSYDTTTRVGNTITIYPAAVND